MNRRLFILCLLLATAITVAGVAGVAGAATGMKPKGGYNPTQTYNGPYGSIIVYYRETFRAKWRRGITGTFPNGVTCPDALSHFKGSGLWQGHLKLNGSCGIPDEPSEWAVGNRLNYDALTNGGQ